MPFKFQFQTSFAFALNILSLSSSSFGLLIGGIIHPSVGLFTLFSHLSFSCIFHTHTCIPQIVIWTIIIHNACSIPIHPRTHLLRFMYFFTGYPPDPIIILQCFDRLIYSMAENRVHLEPTYQESSSHGIHHHPSCIPIHPTNPSDTSYVLLYKITTALNNNIAML